MKKLILLFPLFFFLMTSAQDKKEISPNVKTENKAKQITDSQKKVNKELKKKNEGDESIFRKNINFSFLTSVSSLFISVAGAIVSVGGIYYTRKSFIISSRPYVKATSYAVRDGQNNILSRPDMLGITCRNTPANVIIFKFVIAAEKNGFKKEILHEIKTSMFIFDGVEQNFIITEEEYEEMKKLLIEGYILRRYITIRYLGLNSKKKYEYNLIQIFRQGQENWSDEEERST